MGKELEASIEFTADEQMLGCVGHVINLAAKAGLKAVKASIPDQDSRFSEDEDYSDLQPWVDTDECDEAQNISSIGSRYLSSIVERIHKIVTSINRSPQKASIQIINSCVIS